MTERVKVRLQSFPDCWESCGTCAAEEVLIAEVLVAEGERVSLYDPLLVWEAAKTEVELAAPCDGVIAAVLVAPGDELAAGETVILIDP